MLLVNIGGVKIWEPLGIQFEQNVFVWHSGWRIFIGFINPLTKGIFVSGELYDYDNDPLETENYYNNKEYVSVKKELLDYFAEYAKQQNEELKTSKANRVYTKNL